MRGQREKYGEFGGATTASGAKAKSLRGWCEMKGKNKALANKDEEWVYSIGGDIMCLGVCGKPLDISCGEYFLEHTPFDCCPKPAIFCAGIEKGRQRTLRLVAHKFVEPAGDKILKTKINYDEFISLWQKIEKQALKGGKDV